MGSKKIIIAAGIVAVIAIAVVGFALSKKSATPATTNTDTTTTDKTGSSGTGTVTNVQPSPTPFGRSGFKVTTDDANPYAKNLPRSKEPASLAVGGFSDYKTAVETGLIPDASGQYKQVITNNPFSFVKANGVDYTLPEDQFLNSYYPDSQSLIAGNGSVPVTDSTGTTVQDPNDILVQPSADQQLPSTIATVPGVDPKLFIQTQDNSKTAIISYSTKLSEATKNLDLVYEQTYIITLNQAGDEPSLNTLKTEVLKVRNQIVDIAVPSGLLGMSQRYYLLYSQYANLIDDQLALVKVKNKTQYDAAVAKITTDTQAFVTNYNEIIIDAAIIKKLVKA